MNSLESGRRFTRLEVILRNALRSQARRLPGGEVRERLLRRAAHERANLVYLGHPWQTPVTGAIDRNVWSNVAFFSLMNTFSFPSAHVQIR